jgi:hypothetical protein
MVMVDSRWFDGCLGTSGSFLDDGGDGFNVDLTWLVIIVVNTRNSFHLNPGLSQRPFLYTNS